MRCAMPPHGTLVIRWPAPPSGSDGADPMLSVRPADGGAGSGVGLLRGKTEFRTETCLEGDWKISLRMPSGERNKDARVRANEETVVDLGP